MCSRFAASPRTRLPFESEWRSGYFSTALATCRTFRIADSLTRNSRAKLDLKRPWQRKNCVPCSHFFLEWWHVLSLSFPFWVSPLPAFPPAALLALYTRQAPPPSPLREAAAGLGTPPRLGYPEGLADGLLGDAQTVRRSSVACGLLRCGESGTTLQGFVLKFATV